MPYKESITINRQTHSSHSFTQAQSTKCSKIPCFLEIPTMMKISKKVLSLQDTFISRSDSMISISSTHQQINTGEPQRDTLSHSNNFPRFSICYQILDDKSRHLISSDLISSHLFSLVTHKRAEMR